MGRAAASRIHTPRLVYAHFRVYGAVRQAQGGHRGLRGLADLSLDLLGLAGGREVDGLFEVGAFQGVGFVEQGQGLELSGGDHAFERELAARNVVFDDEIAFLHAGDAGGRFEEFFPVVGADDAPAGGGIERFQNAGKPDIGNRRVSR